MFRLQVYTVHINPNDPAPYEKAEFIAEGFNWAAFVFGLLYALYKRLWFPAAVIFVVDLFLMSLWRDGVMRHAAVTILNIGFNVYIGYAVNDWIRARLKRQGYVLTDIVTGENAMRAGQRFFDRFSAEHTLRPA
jgi:hypothetical protein